MDSCTEANLSMCANVPAPIWARISSFLSACAHARLEVALPKALQLLETSSAQINVNDQVWLARLIQDYPAAPQLFEGQSQGNSRAAYAEMSGVCFLKPRHGHLQRAGQIVDVKPGVARGLSIRVHAQGQAFIVFRLRSSGRSSESSLPLLTESWPLVGLVHDSSHRALKHISAKRRLSVDIAEDESLWSLSLLDRWAWCSNRFVLCSNLTRWTDTFFDACDVGIYLSVGRVAFFRRPAREDCRWESTGFVAAGVTEILRPVVVGSEIGTVRAELVQVAAAAPFEPDVYQEAFDAAWTT